MRSKPCPSTSTGTRNLFRARGFKSLPRYQGPGSETKRAPLASDALLFARAPPQGFLKPMRVAPLVVSVTPA